MRGFAGVMIGALVLAGFAVPPQEVFAQEMEGASVIYLARHAEKATDDPEDPSLSAEGMARAVELARVLGDVPFTTVFSTPFRRTRLTATLLAEANRLPIVEYDPRVAESMSEFMATLRTTPGHHFVSGHSNTTPELVGALGGDPVSPMTEEDYDRLYVVTIAPDGTVTSTLLRYGAVAIAAALGGG